MSPTKAVLQFILAGLAYSAVRAPLSYVTEPEGLYSLPKPQSVVTLLDIINSRPELSKLAHTILTKLDFNDTFHRVQVRRFTQVK